MQRPLYRRRDFFVQRAEFQWGVAIKLNKADCDPPVEEGNNVGVSRWIFNSYSNKRIIFPSTIFPCDEQCEPHTNPLIMDTHQKVNILYSQTILQRNSFSCKWIRISFVRVSSIYDQLTTTNQTFLSSVSLVGGSMRENGGSHLTSEREGIEIGLLEIDCSFGNFWILKNFLFLKSQQFDDYILFFFFIKNKIG